MTIRNALRTRDSQGRATAPRADASKRFATAAAAGLIALACPLSKAMAQQAPPKADVPLLEDDAPEPVAPAPEPAKAAAQSPAPKERSTSGASASLGASIPSGYVRPSLFERSKGLRAWTEYPYQLDMERITVHRPASEVDTYAAPDGAYTRTSLRRSVATLHGSMSAQFPAFDSADGAMTLNLGIYGETQQMKAIITTSDGALHNVSADGRWLDGYQFGATVSGRYRSQDYPLEAVLRIAPSFSGSAIPYEFSDGSHGSVNSRSIMLPWSLELASAPLSDKPVFGFASFGAGAHSFDPTRASFAWLFAEVNASERFKAVFGPHAKFMFTKDREGSSLDLGDRLSPGGDLRLEYLTARNVAAALGASFTYRGPVKTISGFVELDALFNRGLASSAFDSRTALRLGAMGEMGGEEYERLPPVLFVSVGYQVFNPVPYPYTPRPAVEEVKVTTKVPLHPASAAPATTSAPAKAPAPASEPKAAPAPLEGPEETPESPDSASDIKL